MVSPYRSAAARGRRAWDARRGASISISAVLCTLCGAHVAFTIPLCRAQGAVDVLALAVFVVTAIDLCGLVVRRVA